MKTDLKYLSDEILREVNKSGNPSKRKLIQLIKSLNKTIDDIETEMCGSCAGTGKCPDCDGTGEEQ
jgi:hypothetical protein